MGDTQLTPYDRGTFGSRTTPEMNLQLRKVASAARDTLIDLAAAQWQTERKHLNAADGTITDSENKRSVEFAALVKGRQLTETLPADDPLTPAAQWTVAGQPLPKVNGRDFVTGKHRYPCDQKLPDMFYGKIVRPASFGATLVSVDTKEAEQIPGVMVVHDGDFIGVAASSPEQLLVQRPRFAPNGNRNRKFPRRNFSHISRKIRWKAVGRWSRHSGMRQAR